LIVISPEEIQGLLELIKEVIMFRIECYVGFTDRTWDIFTVDVPGINPPEEEALDKVHDMMKDRNDVAFIGILHIEHKDPEEVQ